MDQPLGFITRQEKVCKLKKVIYNPYKSPQAQFEKFSHIMLDYDFRRSQADHSVFIKHTSKGLVIVEVYDQMVDMFTMTLIVDCFFLCVTSWECMIYILQLEGECY